VATTRSPARRLRGAVARHLLKLPGGVRVLGMARLGFRAGRDTARVARHPLAVARRRPDHRGWPWTDVDIAILTNRIEEDSPFLSSNRLAGRCRYVYKQGGSLIVHEEIENDWYYCRTADIHEFFETSPGKDFVLFTGHTDLPVDRTHRRYLRRPGPKAWFAVNLMLKHPKVRAVPFGIGGLANPDDTATLRRVQQRNLPKRQLFHCQFEVDRNPFERAYCLEQTGVPLGAWMPWAEYLEDLASSYFCISPNGIGIDCARTWEALLVRTIPVVRRSLVAQHHPDFPMIVLDDWSEFRSLQFSPELYERTWSDWDPDELLLERYLRRVERFLRIDR
jgi:hypothetical protein